MNKIGAMLVWGLLAGMLAGCGEAAPGAESASPSGQVATATPDAAGEPNRAGSRPATVTPPPPGGLVRYDIDPKTTDPAINQFPDNHIVMLNPAVAAKGRLFVFMAGSYGKPANSSLLLQTGANEGYHVIGLSYPNDWVVATLCRRDQDAACFEKVRMEILDGQDRTDKVTVNPANSIENRLVKLLLYLHQQQPGQGWNRFVDGSKPRWDLMTVAGHSQGGGQAAIVGREHAVGRVVMLASPNDEGAGARGTAPWLSTLHATPVERYYALAHRQDPGFSSQQNAWKALGMEATGPLINVEGQAYPYQNAHRLTTGVVPARDSEYHGSVVVDRHTPLAPDGTPVLREVWRYLCFG